MFLPGCRSQSLSTTASQIGKNPLWYEQANVGVQLPGMNWDTVSHVMTGASGICFGKTWEDGHCIQIWASMVVPGLCAFGHAPGTGHH